MNAAGAFDWRPVLEGTITGLVGATLIALLTTGRNRFRDLRLRRGIVRNLDKLSAGHGITGLTTTVRNQTGQEMTVRKIALLVDGTYVVLPPTGDLTSSYKRKRRKLTKLELRRLNAGEAVQMESEMQFGSWKVGRNANGFITLPPYTEAGFVLPLEAFFQGKTIGGARAVIEYTTRSGEKKILEHDVRRELLADMQKAFDHLIKELQSGRLNEVRKMFNLPAINMPSTAPSE